MIRGNDTLCFPNVFEAKNDVIPAQAGIQPTGSGLKAWAAVKPSLEGGL